jgi:ATP-dependent RNA helicase DDX24/MAK5
VDLGGNSGGDDETKNHYDDRKLSKKALRELPVNPGEDVGMFYGLEVCNDYDVRGRRIDAKEARTESPSVSQETKGSKGKKRKRKNEIDDSERTKVESSSKNDVPPASKKKEKRKKNERNTESSSSSGKVSVKTGDQNSISTEKQEDRIDQSKFYQLQQAWGNVLDVKLAESLYRKKFFQPTPIQAATLSPAILGRRNIVGAAPTGSGKT